MEKQNVSENLFYNQLKPLKEERLNLPIEKVIP